jgi:hypothetical protein
MIDIPSLLRCSFRVSPVGRCAVRSEETLPLPQPDRFMGKAARLIIQGPLSRGNSSMRLRFSFMASWFSLLLFAQQIIFALDGFPWS